MAYYVFQGLDRPGSEAVRNQTREAHRAHLRQAFPGCRCLLGGPLTDDADHMIGTVLILEADDRDAAAGFIARDPYTGNDLFAETRLTRWRWTMGAPDISAAAPSP